MGMCGWCGGWNGWALPTASDRGHRRAGQFERDLICDRTKAGLAVAFARGRKLVVNEEKLHRTREYMAKGLNVRETAARPKAGKTALYAALQVASEADP